MTAAPLKPPGEEDDLDENVQVSIRQCCGSGIRCLFHPGSGMIKNGSGLIKNGSGLRGYPYNNGKSVAY